MMLKMTLYCLVEAPWDVLSYNQDYGKGTKMEGIGKLIGALIVGAIIGAILLAQVGGFQSPTAVKKTVATAVNEALVAELVPGLTETCVAAAQADEGLMAKLNGTTNVSSRQSAVRSAKLVTHTNSAVKTAVEKACAAAAVQ